MKNLLDFLSDEEKQSLDYKKNKKIQEFDRVAMELRMTVALYSAQESQSEATLRGIDERIRIQKSYRDMELSVTNGKPEPHIRELTKLEQQKEYVEKGLSSSLGFRKVAEQKLLELEGQAEPLKLNAKLESAKLANELYVPALIELQKTLEKAHEQVARCLSIKNFTAEVFPYISNRSQQEHREIPTAGDLADFGAWPELFSNVAMYDWRMKEIEKAIRHSEKVLKQSQKDLKRGA